jgi:hypothetical protein
MFQKSHTYISFAVALAVLGPANISFAVALLLSSAYANISFAVALAVLGSRQYIVRCYTTTVPLPLPRATYHSLLHLQPHISTSFSVALSVLACATESFDIALAVLACVNNSLSVVPSVRACANHSLSVALAVFACANNSLSVVPADRA